MLQASFTESTPRDEAMSHAPHHPMHAGGVDSCKAGGFTVASTSPGQQAALASPNEAYVLLLSPTGELTITERATGRVLMSSSAKTNCLPPFQLLLRPNGLLVLQDKKGSALWTSGGACSGNSSCYSYALQNNGQLVVMDGSRAQVWTSIGADAAAAAGQMSQLMSSDKAAIACIASGPSPAARHLLSPSAQYKLLVAQQAARLQLLDTLAAGAEAWSPSGALPGQAPARLCINSQGTLVLSAAGPAQQLWSSGLLASPAAGPYVALVTDDSCLEVRDGRCQLVWNSHDGVVNTRRSRRPPSLTVQPGGSSNSSSSRAPRGSPQPTQAGSTARPPRGSLTISKPANPQPSSVAVSAPRKPRGQAQPPPIKAESSLTPVAKPPKSSSSSGRSGRQQPASASASQQAGSSQQQGVAATSTSSSAAGPACLLQQGQPCGGISLCGNNGVCAHTGCCGTGLACLRQSDFLWRCE